MNCRMQLRTFATFESDFPDDGKFSTVGETVRPDGYNIAQTLCSMLKNRGLKTSQPEQYSYYGWAFLASDGRITIWFLLQCPGPWLLLSRSKAALIRKLFDARITARHRGILELLNETLRQDPRFHNIRWFYKKEFEKKDRPVGQPNP